MEYGDCYRVPLDWNLMLLNRPSSVPGIESIRARARCLDTGTQGVGAEFEADLIVALPRRAMGDCVGAGFMGDFHQPSGDQRTRDRGAEQVFAFIQRIGAEHWIDVLGNEFLAQILDEDFPDAHGFGLGAGRLDFLALTDVGGEGHDFAIVGLLQPLRDNRGVETARIGQHHLSDLGHARSPPAKKSAF